MTSIVCQSNDNIVCFGGINAPKNTESGLNERLNAKPVFISSVYIFRLQMFK